MSFEVGSDQSGNRAVGSIAPPLLCPMIGCPQRVPMIEALRSGGSLKLVLLPGLDGTGVLFGPLLSVLPKTLETLVVPLKQEAGLSYTEQAEYVASKLGDERIVLLAESYAGMVAYALVQSKRLNISHLVFVASFLSRPSALSRLAPILPVNVARSSLVPKRLMGALLFGSFSSLELVELFYSALNEVDAQVIRWRVRQVSRLSPPQTKLEVPCTYLGATHDRLVSHRVMKQVEKLCPNLMVKRVPGTHFLLQTNPTPCAEILSNIAQKIDFAG